MAKTSQKEITTDPTPISKETAEVIVETLSQSNPCIVGSRVDGGLGVLFIVDPLVTARLRRRANGVPLDRYLWEQILQRAVTDFVY